MSMEDFNRAVAITLAHEGGLVDNPFDRGGRTNYGVTQAVWFTWLDRLGEPRRPVDDITVQEARDIYHRNYWQAAHCDDFEWPVSLLLFDAAVNHGPKASIRVMQRTLGVLDDGLVGRDTRGAAGRRAPVELAQAMLWERADLFAQIVRANHSQALFIVGWIRRLMHLHSIVLEEPIPPNFDRALLAGEVARLQDLLRDVRGDLDLTIVSIDAALR